MPKKETSALPIQLKKGIEELSGMDVSAVKVHTNPDKPAQLAGTDITQRTEIHLAPGQEKHLSHEAWHVVQQQNGSIKPDKATRPEMINDDKTLEQEADTMGANAINGSSSINSSRKGSPDTQ